MLRVGLTGGIGSGKSTVSGSLAAAGCIIIDADQIARAVVEPGQPALQRIVERFGPDVLAGQALDRSALADIVFADRDALADLEAITHPAIEARTADLFAAAPESAIVVHDMPLLVEKDLGEAYHLVITVEADEALRTSRLIRDRGMSAEQVRARVAAQASRAERSAVADVVLSNDGSRDELLAAVQQVLASRVLPLADNLSAGRRARPLESELPDPGLRARRLVARLRAHLPDTARTIDVVAAPHPGVRVVVGLESPADASAPEFVSGMARAALVPLPKDTQAVEFASADPGAPATAVTMVAGSPAWLEALGADQRPRS